MHSHCTALPKSLCYLILPLLRLFQLILSSTVWDLSMFKLPMAQNSATLTSPGSFRHFSKVGFWFMPGTFRDTWLRASRNGQTCQIYPSRRCTGLPWFSTLPSKIILCQRLPPIGFGTVCFGSFSCVSWSPTFVTPVKEHVIKAKPANIVNYLAYWPTAQGMTQGWWRCCWWMSEWINESIWMVS